MSKANGVFISYRRDGGDGLAGRVRDALRQRGYRVFLDVEDLRSGKFNEALFSQIERSTDFVVILSAGALDRCVNDGDWVRLEIAHALKLRKNIVPVLGRNFHFPKELPADIADLRHYNGIGASHDFFEASMDKLAAHLKTRRRRPALLAAVAAGVILAGMVAATLLLRSSEVEKALPAITAPGPQPAATPPAATAAVSAPTTKPPAADPGATSAVPAKPVTRYVQDIPAGMADRYLESFWYNPVDGYVFFSSLHKTPAAVATLPGGIREIRLGESPGQLDLVYRLPAEAAKWTREVREFPVRQGQPAIYAQLVMADGSTSSVRVLEEYPEKKDTVWPEGLRLTAKESANSNAPIVFTSLTKNNRFSPMTRDLRREATDGRVTLGFVAPRPVAQWKIATDDLRFPDVEVYGAGWSGNALLSFKQFTAVSAARPLLVSWVDESGAEHGPFSFDLTPAREMFFGLMKRLLDRDTARYVNFAVAPPKEEWSEDMKRSYPDHSIKAYMRREGLDFATQPGIWIWSRGRGRYERIAMDGEMTRTGERQLTGATRPWYVVERIRLGPSPDKLDQVVPVTATFRDFLEGKPDSDWLVRLEPGSSYLYLQFEFSDHTKSEIQRFQVSEMRKIPWDKN